MIIVNKYYEKVGRGKAPWVEVVRKDLTANMKMVRQNLVVGEESSQKRGKKIGECMETIKGRTEKASLIKMDNL